MYTFDVALETARETYQAVCDSYHRIFKKLGLDVIQGKSPLGTLEPGCEISNLGIGGKLLSSVRCLATMTVLHQLFFYHYMWNYERISVTYARSVEIG